MTDDKDESSGGSEFATGERLNGRRVFFNAFDGSYYVKVDGEVISAMSVEDLAAFLDARTFRP